MDLRIVIVDDEPAARITLRNLLQANIPGIIITGEAGGVSEALQVLKENKTDLLLLDIEMEDGSGFDLLDQIPNPQFNIVFTTAHNDFAIRAFRYHALDYLLKPINPDELIVTIQKVRQNNNYAFLQQQLAILSETNLKQTLTRITLMTSTGPVFVAPEDISRIESYGNYTFVYLIYNERLLVSRNLKEFEELLPCPPLYRIHQSHMVNKNFVTKILKEDGVFAIMKDGGKIPVARRKKDTFLESLS